MASKIGDAANLSKKKARKPMSKSCSKAVKVISKFIIVLNLVDRSELISMEDNYKHVTMLSESRAESIYENIG